MIITLNARFSLCQRQRRLMRRLMSLRLLVSVAIITTRVILASSATTAAFTLAHHHSGQQQQQLHQQMASSSSPWDKAATATRSAAVPAKLWGIRPPPRRRISGVTVLHMAVSNNNEDPFSILGLSSPTADIKEIKRAYKRMALKFHPDVVTNKDSTPLERKAAGDRFAKINAAYELLSGKNNQNGKQQGSYAGSSTSSSAGSSSASSTGGWTPPHRRPGSYSSSSSTGSPPSADWRDYIPNYNKEQDEMYDTGGDSFGKIFSDLFATAAAGAAGVAGSGGGVFKDFVEFLENNVDGYTAGSSSSSGSGGGDDDDAELKFLLQTGTMPEIRDEMDDTELVVQQLTAKMRNLKDDILLFTTDLAVSARYTEKMGINAQLSESKARLKVVENYLAKARKRLLKLQTRYKQLLVNGGDVGRGGAGGRERTSPSSSPSGYSSSSSYQPQSDRGNRATSGTTTTSESRTGSNKNNAKDDETWKEEGFGSFGRGRGSSRRQRASSRTTTPASTGQTSPSSSSTSSSSYSSPSSSSSSYRSGAGTSTTATSSTARSTTGTTGRSSSSPQDTIPPHRRTSSSYASAQEDKRRLRELQVEDEFDKLKKELGL